MQPTVVTDVDSSNLLFQEELFGPVLAVTSKFDVDILDPSVEAKGVLALFDTNT